MKRVIFIVTGSLALLVLGTILISFLPEWGGGSLQGEDRADFVVKILLSVWFGLLIIGGWLGNHLFKRNLTRRSRGRS